MRELADDPEGAEDDYVHEEIAENLQALEDSRPGLAAQRRARARGESLMLRRCTPAPRGSAPGRGRDATGLSRWLPRRRTGRYRAPTRARWSRTPSGEMSRGSIVPRDRRRDAEGSGQAASRGRWTRSAIVDGQRRWSRRVVVRVRRAERDDATMPHVVRSTAGRQSGDQLRSCDAWISAQVPDPCADRWLSRAQLPQTAERWCRPTDARHCGVAAGDDICSEPRTRSSTMC